MPAPAHTPGRITAIIAHVGSPSQSMGGANQRILLRNPPAVGS